jgi:hypothetical protein
MTRLMKRILISTLCCLSLCSCFLGHRYYDVYARLYDGGSVTRDLAPEIGRALAPLGFTGGQTIVANYYGYSLFGHDRIDVAIDTATLAIRVQDYRHSDETELDAKIIGTIRQVVIKLTGYDVQFIRGGPDYFSSTLSNRPT